MDSPLAIRIDAASLDPPDGFPDRSKPLWVASMADPRGGAGLPHRPATGRTHANGPSNAARLSAAPCYPRRLRELTNIIGQRCAQNLTTRIRQPKIFLRCANLRRIRVP